MKTRKDITNRADVHSLVQAFYRKIRTHEILGPVFEAVITDWEEHFGILTDFWETQLFRKKTYKGNPVFAHQELDEKVNHSITSTHFGLWLNLWYETIDELFMGETSQIAKNRAQKMSTMLFMKIFEGRQQH